MASQIWRICGAVGMGRECSIWARLPRSVALEVITSEARTAVRTGMVASSRAMSAWMASSVSRRMMPRTVGSFQSGTAGLSE